MSNLFGAANDNDESLQGQGGNWGNFGLNENARITKLEYNPNGGAGGSALDVVDITVTIDEKEHRNRIFLDIKSAYNGGTLYKQGDQGFDEAFAKEWAQRRGVITHSVKATGVTQEQIDRAFATPAANAVEWAKIMTGLKPNDFNQKPVDVFLEYQNKPSAGQTKTYLQQPDNMKGGKFLVPHENPVGSWKEVRDTNGLKYVDDAGNEHTFKRDAYYMKQPKANQIVINSTPTQSSNPMQGGGATSGEDW